MNRAGATLRETDAAIAAARRGGAWGKPLAPGAKFVRGARRDVPGWGTQYMLDFEGEGEGKLVRTRLAQTLADWGGPAPRDAPAAVAPVHLAMALSGR